MVDKSKVIAILLAYNSKNTIKEFYENLPKHLFDEILLFDDSSQDGTFEISKFLGIKSYRNRVNLGYGGNLKKALAVAVSKNADIIVDIHPDNEYKPDAIPHALKLVEKGIELVLGNRFYKANYISNKSGMFKWKIIPIVLLNYISRILLRIKVNDLHQGFRVYSKSLLEKINFEKNSSDYLFSFELISQAVFTKSKIAEVPVKTQYKGDKRGAKLKSSIIYTVGTFKTLLLFLLAKSGFEVTIFKNTNEKLIKRAKNILKA